MGETVPAYALPCSAAGRALALALAGAVIPAPALAQRTEQNAATQSEDAFGRAIGNDRSGLYSSEEVRGFNPSEAGNIRLEGLYFDLSGLLTPRLIEGNTIRVGVAAQRYPFPAPTGLVDYQLTIPHAAAELSIEIDNSGSIARGPGLAADFKLPIAGEQLGLAGGIGLRQAIRPEGGRHEFRTAAAVAAIRPSADSEILLFGGLLRTRSFEARATYFPAATQPPPQLERGKYRGLDWTQQNNFGESFGGLGKLTLGEGLRIHAGLFHSRRETQNFFADLLLGVTPDGKAANRLVIADDNVSDASLSGDFRLIREWQAGPLSHRLIASVRGRSRDRLFGGSRSLSLGAVSILTADHQPRPDFTLGPKSEDRVRQLTAGLSYDLLWQGKASLDVGLSSSHYTKRLDFADPALADAVTRDRPLLWNVAASVSLTKAIILYGGMSHGQEDALVAPDIAVNQSEAPPAIRTRQVEAGLRFAINPQLTLVTGVFAIKKPYFNLDPGLRYRQLGQLTNRGIELSLTGHIAPGVNLVGGMLLLDPRISGEAVDSGLIGRRPVGQTRRRVVANLDWRMQGGKGPLSFDLAVESFSSRMGNSANTLSAPPRTNVNLGARYRFNLGQTSLLLRPQVLNLFDSYGWQVSQSGGFNYTPRRNIAVSLTADF